MWDKIKEYRVHIICLFVGILLGFIVTYICINFCFNVRSSDGVNIYEKNIASSLIDDDIHSEEGSADISDAVSDTSYMSVLDDYRLYLQSRKVGDEVVLGNYEQDDNIYNGKEDIEWLVLYKSNKNSMLLISKYVLDCMPYDMSKKMCTWKDSDIRDYLNNDFYDIAFNDAYKTFIMENEMANNKNINYKTDAGEETIDKVFLLSESQARKYFSKDEKDGSNLSRIATPTKYAKGKGVAPIVDKNLWYDGSCSYFLRTPGVDQSRVEVIEPMGSIYQYGELISDTEIGIRPCIWVKYGGI